ncbi:signal peptidase I [Enterococcus florum]|uniref:Signal peptidase I n=1 Tax=Enterococcus florum TaxID=2480627 RepID=A0A4P5PFW8_9ENTE|nr:signal peptidase I [Enterococcus florum]GCF95674.1 signal peptidase I [Enterococcus florum]
MEKKRKLFSIIVVVCVFVFVLKLYFISPVIIMDDSMYPTLKNEEIALITKRGKLRNFDIVVSSTLDKKRKNIVKRIIGLPGDTIKIHNDRLSINGNVRKESYLTSNKDAFDKFKKECPDIEAFQVGTASHRRTYTENLELTVPKNKYFVLGDNRMVSSDSRTYDFIDRSSIQGKVWVSFWPRFQLFSDDH